MITETEKKALQLAKKVFEHFTHDSLPIAREILAMEHELGIGPINGKPVNGDEQTILEVKKTDGQPEKVASNNLPESDIQAIGLEIPDDPAQPVRTLHRELVYSPADDLPF